MRLMSSDTWVGEVSDRDREGQADRVYGAGFTEGSLARIGARVDSDWFSPKFFIKILLVKNFVWL